MSESHCIRFVTCASETRLRAGGGASSDGVMGRIVMAAWGCGAVMTSLCGEGLRLAPRGAAILVVALHTDQAKLGGSPLRFTKPRDGRRSTGQPLIINTSCSDAATQAGQPPSAFWAPAAATVRPMDKSAPSLRKKAQNPLPDR